MKKVKQKLLSILILLCAILVTKNIKVYGAESGAALFDTLYVGVREHDSVYGSPALYYYTLDGRIAYCLEMAVKVVKTEYGPITYNDPRIAYAITADHGYTNNQAADFQIRQAVIWALLGQINIENLYAGDAGCVQAAKNLYYSAVSYTGNIDSPSASETALYFHVEGMQYVSNNITVRRGASSDYYDIILSGLPVGSFISNTSGGAIDTSHLTSDTQIQVRIPLENILSDINSIDLIANSRGTVLNTRNAYVSQGPKSQMLLPPDITNTPTTNPLRFILGNRILAVGGLEVKKVDEYNKPIKGTTFKVSNGSITKTETTGDDGIARFSDLPAGTYTIEETSAAYGYYNDKVTISQRVITGITVNTSKSNKEEKGRIKIIKRDDVTGNIPQGDAKLEGAVYKVYAREDIYTPNGSTLIYHKDQEVATLTTNSEGTTNTADLPLGNYMYKETQASEGYLLNDTENLFTISYDGQDIEFKEYMFTSQETVKTNDIAIIKKLQKTDSTPQLNLSGAKFSATLKSDRSKVYESTVTDDSGYCVIENLPYGTYEVEEIVVPDVALKIDNFDVFVDQDSSEREPYQYTKEDVAKKMKITIHKEDIETGTTTQGDAKLDGAKYTIYRDEALTDAIETVTIHDLQAETGWYLAGTYYIKETSRPEGYLIDEQTYKVVQIPAEQTVEFSYHDITSKELVEKGNIYIAKYAENNTNDGRGSTTKPGAAGVELTLTLNSKPETNYKAVIQDNGYAEFIDIPYGWYTITETKSLEFVDIMDPQQVYVSYNEQKLYYIIQDPRNERKLKIIKKDSETGNTVPLAGATFRIWDVAGKKYIKQTINYPTPFEIEEFTTSSDGTLVLPDGLIPGEYELEELTAPYGYVLSRDRMKFNINATTPENPEFIETTEVEFPNTAQKAVVKVIKKAEVFSSKKREDDMTRPVYEEKGLEGVEYTITAKEDITTPDGSVRMRNGDTITFVTGEDGVGKSQELYLGAYSIKESRTVDGYIIQSEEIPFILEYKGQEIDIYEKNMDYLNVRQKIKLKLAKEMEDSEYKDILNDAYKDIVFGIYAQEDLVNYKGEKIIDKDTLVDKLYITEEKVSTPCYDLPLGKYYIKEISTNENYKLNEKTYPFEFSSPDDTSSVVDVNIEGKINNDLDELTKLRLLKIAKENRTFLESIGDALTGYDPKVKTHTISGVKFKLYYDKNGVPTDLVNVNGDNVYTTNEEGIIEVENLPYGKYYYQEISVPFGYELDNSLHEVEIVKGEDEDKTVELVVENKLVEVRLFTKLDAFSSEVIPDCKFEILNEQREVIYTNTTNDEGEFYMSVDLLSPGKVYYYHELSAPEMYELNDELHEFTVNEDYTIDKSTVENLRKTSNVKISKSDFLSKEKIPNCKFELRSLESEWVKEGVTDENGDYYFENVPYGEYTYTELEAPKDYNIDTTPHRVTIDSQTRELNITDERMIDVFTADIVFSSILPIIGLSIFGMIWLVYKRKILE